MAATKCFFLFFAFLQTQTIVAAPQAQKNGHPNADGHQQLKPRTVAPLSSQSSQTSTSRHLSSTASSPFHLPTFVTIRAVPIRITKQMQYVTSYNPIVTICPLAGQPLPIQPSLPLPGLPNGTNPTLLSTGILPRSPDLVGKAVLARQVANVTTCETFWEPIPTPICHTTLSPLAAPLIVVSECHQSVTFSSQFGYVLASGISAPTVVTTYYVAPWSELHPGSVPTKSVVAKVCSSGRRDCTTKKEKWDMQLSEYTEVARKTVLVHVTIVGPVTVIVDPAIEPITIDSGSPSSVHFTAVVETTQTSTVVAITKATVSSDDVAVTRGVPTGLDVADGVVTASSTRTRTVTAALASSTRTLGLLTGSA